MLRLRKIYSICDFNMKILYVIPARKGSKGLPGKNIKILGDQPLINYSLNFARLFAEDKDICVSTDSEEIGKVVTYSGYQVPFYRPEGLSGDGSGMYEVVLHALGMYEQKNGEYDAVVLLQPTSPFRRKFFLEEVLVLFGEGTDMVVGVKESKANPYFNLFEENEMGFLGLCKNSDGILRRQDAPKAYQYNGSLYMLNRKSLRCHSSFLEFSRIVKYLMPDNYSVDIDSEIDWDIAEYLLQNHLVTADGKY
jgi:N-acylneuraminate cytidylyltransferase